MLRRFFLTALFSAPLAGCLPSPTDTTSQSAKFVGRWVEVLLGSDGDGFELFADGHATSIGQPDLTYVSWRAKPDKLFLTTVAFGETTETEYSASLDDTNTLRLSNGDKDDWPRVFRMTD